MAPRPSALRHRLIVEQIAARQGKSYMAAAAAAAADASTTQHHHHHGAAVSAISRFAPSSFQDGNGFLSPWSATDGTLTAKVPGLKASATFLSSLRTNLSLPDCPSPSHSPLLTATPHPLPPSPLIISTLPTPMATLDLDALSPPAAPQPSTGASLPSSSSSSSETAPAPAVPELTTYLTTSPDEQLAALKLVADSIAQQSSLASRALLFHPLNLAFFVALSALVARWLYKDRSDAGIVLTTLAGLAMAALVGVRGCTRGYIDAAEGTGRDEAWWGRDCWVARYGEEIIGAAFVEWSGTRRGSEGEMAVVGPAQGQGGHARRASAGRKRRARADIVAWTVRLKYRGKGVGEGLLEAVVDDVKSRGTEVGFAAEHANSKRVLWDMYNAAFERKEQRARRALQKVWDSRAGSGKRKK
ncbi:Protein transport protein sec1 [Sphaceloma murrayae]|uniref:Protein transport protein sec1 n=1 Tax=Sphaceloma murrayae TaxID=2082308 RepID=A0A2K1QTR5_9PEZI|nr:Protein transport protein sec1 [Sphaceloma murrayae]